MRPIALVVDDDAATLRVLPEVLRLHLPNLTVHTSGSARDALTRLNVRPYHAVLSDIRMPEMDGVALLMEIKTLRPEIPVVLTTGEADSLLLTQAFEARAFDFVPKPFDRKDLAATLQLAISAYTLARNITAIRLRIARRLEDLTGNNSRGVSQRSLRTNARAVTDQSAVHPRRAEDARVNSAGPIERMEQRCREYKESLRLIEEQVHQRALNRFRFAV